MEVAMLVVVVQLAFLMMMLWKRSKSSQFSERHEDWTRALEDTFKNKIDLFLTSSSPERSRQGKSVVLKPSSEFSRRHGR
jgi:hypothetical protein